MIDWTQITNTRAALLYAIAAAPKDIQQRFALRDWLLDQGDEDRFEFMEADYTTLLTQNARQLKALQLFDHHGLHKAQTHIEEYKKCEQSQNQHGWMWLIEDIQSCCDFHVSGDDIKSLFGTPVYRSGAVEEIVIYPDADTYCGQEKKLDLVVALCRACPIIMLHIKPSRTETRTFNFNTIMYDLANHLRRFYRRVLNTTVVFTERSLRQDADMLLVFARYFARVPDPLIKDWKNVEYYERKYWRNYRL